MIHLKYFKLILLINLILLHFNSVGQKKCQDTVIYYTSDMGNGIEQLNFPLKFEIKQGSILIMSPESNTQVPAFASFKIIKKECQWDTTFSNGISLYEIISNDPSAPRKGIINIRIHDKKGRVQLLYENSEPRIFTIKEMKFD